MSDWHDPNVTPARLFPGNVVEPPDWTDALVFGPCLVVSSSGGGDCVMCTNDKCVAVFGLARITEACWARRKMC